MKRIGAALAVAVSLTLVACGGGGSKTASSVASDSSFCASARSIVSSLGGTFFTDPRGVQRVLGQVEKLTPPAAIAPQWPAFLDYARKLAAIAPRDPDAASKALDVLGQAPADVSKVVTYLVNTCQVDSSAASDLSDLSPRG